MSEIVMSQDQYRETFPAQYREACADDPDNVGGKPFTPPAWDENHSDVITGKGPCGASCETAAEQIARLTAERDRARDVAVLLEQRLAEVEDAVEAAAATMAKLLNIARIRILNRKGES